MLKIYHNPRCRKSRAGLEYLKLKTNEFQVIYYLKDGLTENDLKEIMLKTNLKAIDLVRKVEDAYKKELKGKSFTDEEWIKIIIENPKLLRRPVIVAKHKAMVGESAERIEEVLK